MARLLTKKLYIAALVALAVVFLSGLCTQEYKTVYKTHVVMSGQTVWDIAGNYLHEQDKFPDVREFVHTIILENNIKGKFIHPGDVLIIPLNVKSSKEATK